MLRREGQNLIAIPFEFAQTGPVVFPVFGEDLAVFHAGDEADEVGEPLHKGFERREPGGFACLQMCEGDRVGHARSITSPHWLWDGRFQNAGILDSRALMLFGFVSESVAPIPGNCGGGCAR